MYPKGYNVSEGIIYNIKLYVTAEGKIPVIDWLESLDKQVRYRIKERLDRVRLGNLGDHRFLVNGVSELRLSFGAGYRVYYAIEEDNIVLLLSGGDKSSQSKDITRAIFYWHDYLKR